MRRFGEIGRIKSDKLEYIIYSCRHEYKQLDIPWFDIWISSKSSKKNNITQYDLLNKTFNVYAIRSIENIIKKYLIETKPLYLAIGAYEIDYEKRINFYTKRLKTMNYEIIDSDKHTYIKPIYIFKRNI